MRILDFEKASLVFKRGLYFSPALATLTSIQDGALFKSGSDRACTVLFAATKTTYLPNKRLKTHLCLYIYIVLSESKNNKTLGHQASISSQKPLRRP